MLLSLMITKFQLRVYKEVKKIARGKTMTYGEIAKILKTSPRAIGQALKRNKNPKIPCHRVICSNGKLGGYNRGVRKKIKLLKLENSLNSHSSQKSKDF
jgi:methylated-DNA-[protein]-cysteine S-methyltransferase